MRLPFSLEQFLDVFRRYNETVWPAQWLLVALAAGAVALATRSQGNSRSINTILAALWLWMGVAYHLAFFSAVNGAAIVFAIAFITQGVLFAWMAGRTDSPPYRVRLNVAGVIGAVLVAYALLGYPLLGYALGHRYPAAPTFGVPCPTTILTFGLMAWVDGRIPHRLLVIPVLWSLVGLSAAVSLTMTEDFALPVAAATLLIVVFRNRRHDTRAAADHLAVLRRVGHA
jgi:hypothetical protein